MKRDSAANTLQKFTDECIQCDICLNECLLLNDVSLKPNEIAFSVSCDQVDDKLLAAIQRCDLCGHCSQNCPVDLDPAELIQAAREVLVQKGFTSVEDYDVMRVDHDWNFFTLYRDSFDIRYDDLSSGASEAIFFPGCTLACYAPELTRAAFNWLKGGRLSQVGFFDLCCGKPLDSIGLSFETDHYLDCLRRRLEQTGAREIITACPNCEVQLKNRLPGITICSIYALMLEAGIRLGGRATLTFHDSCSDRYNSKSGEEIRQILSGFTQVEMASQRENTICCGSGGIVSMIDPDLCTSRAQQRMAEFIETEADSCVTGCMACAHRLARVGKPSQVTHLLEYVFGLRVNYAQIEKNIYAMWEGSKGEINRLRLAQNHVLHAG